jgi:hypothetical protein
VTVFIKAASSYIREKKLAELGALIRGVSYPGISYVGVKANTNYNTRTKTNAKGASNPQAQTQRKPDYLERQVKLKELSKLVRG